MSSSVTGTADNTASWGVKGENAFPPPSRPFPFESSVPITGVWGDAPNYPGVTGTSNTDNGVLGESATGMGVWGGSASSTFLGRVSYGRFGFLGGSDPHYQQDAGAYGESSGQGVFGRSSGANGTGVYGECASGQAIRGLTTSGVAIHGSVGVPTAPPSLPLAGYFHGDVFCTGTVNVGTDVVLVNQDCAEDFDVSDPDIDSGTVVVLNESGSLQCCQEAYDKKVAGVISGAGDFRAAITLGRVASETARMPVALMGKVYCKVDANYSPVEVGDLLTKSPTRGHAMRAADPVRSFGTVIGKALRRLDGG